MLQVDIDEFGQLELLLLCFAELLLELGVDCGDQLGVEGGLLDYILESVALLVLATLVLLCRTVFLELLT